MIDGMIRTTGLLIANLFAQIVLITSCGQPQDHASVLAPDISFTLYQGEDLLGAKELRLSDLRGRPIVLNFWAGLCPPCRAELPHLQALANTVDPTVIVLGLDIGPFTGLGSLEDGLILLDELDVTYPAGTTNDFQAVEAFRIKAMPSTIFINGSGTIFKRWTGSLDIEALNQITNQMLSDKVSHLPAAYPLNSP